MSAGALGCSHRSRAKSMTRTPQMISSPWVEVTSLLGVSIVAALKEASGAGETANTFRARRAAIWSTVSL